MGARGGHALGLPVVVLGRGRLSLQLSISFLLVSYLMCLLNFGTKFFVCWGECNTRGFWLACVILL